MGGTSIKSYQMLKGYPVQIPKNPDQATVFNEVDSPLEQEFSCMVNFLLVKLTIISQYNNLQPANDCSKTFSPDTRHKWAQSMFLLAVTT